MIKQAATGLLFVLLAAPAYAALPDDVLNRDFQNCVGGDKDPNRIKYCDCVRSGMKDWSENMYIESMMQAMSVATGTKTQASNNLEELAKKCVAQALKSGD